MDEILAHASFNNVRDDCGLDLEQTWKGEVERELIRGLSNAINTTPETVDGMLDDWFPECKIYRLDVGSDDAFVIAVRYCDDIVFSVRAERFDNSRDTMWIISPCTVSLNIVDKDAVCTFEPDSHKEDS